MSEQLEVKNLNIEHLSGVMELQNKIIANLQEDEKHFILKRSAAEFLKALDGENVYMLGIFDGDKLVAQSMFEFPENVGKRELAEFAPEIDCDDLVIYKATLVDPSYRGRGLMQELLRLREQKAKIEGKKTAISQIAIDNPASWINAIKSGMSIRKVDKDPFDGAKVLYMQKDFYKPLAISKTKNCFSMYIGKNIHKEIPALFNKMHYLAEAGYCGIEFVGKENKIVWAKPEELRIVTLQRQFAKMPNYFASGQGKTIHR